MNAMKFEIERRENLSYEEFAREYLYPLKPVIVTDAFRGWQALKHWTPKFFKQEFGGMTFSINEDPNQKADYRGTRAARNILWRGSLIASWSRLTKTRRRISAIESSMTYSLP